MSNATSAASVEESVDGTETAAALSSLLVPVETDGMRAWAEALVDQARSEGVALTGEDGLLTSMVREVLQTGLDVEMADHLGYEPYESIGRGSGNSRNGAYPKTVRTDVGPVELRMPRDRQGTFEPVTVPKHVRRLDGLGANVISLYAKGLTTGEIQAHLAEIYDTEVSRETISKITDQVLPDMVAWQSRPLDRVYPVMLIDAIVVKVRDSQVANRPVYVAIGVNLDGEPQRSYLDTTAQIQALLDAAGQLDDEAHRDRRHIKRRAMIATLVFAGLRIGELCELRWRDVDIQGEWLHVGQTKTDAGTRRIKIRGALKAELVRMRAGQEPVDPDSFVFPTSAGRRQSTDNLRSRVIGTSVERASKNFVARGLPPLPDKITPHSLRRTFASVLYAIGEDPGVVMDEMGHTDPALALRVYRQSMRRGEDEKIALRHVVDG